MNESKLLPRLIRFRDAPEYLGMDRNRFNSQVRPYVIEIPIGTQGIAFDRLDLDAWVEDYKSRSGRLTGTNSRSMELWDAKERQASLKEAKSGILKSKSSEAAFEKALALGHSVKQKNFSQGTSRK